MYATSDDIVAIYGQDLVDLVSIRPGDEDGSTCIAQALTYAGGLIDARLSRRFALPLPIVPELLRDIAVDLAVARMAYTPTLSTEMIRDRERRAHRDLVEIADGKMNLGLPAISQADDGRPVEASSIIGGGCRQKVFTRDRLRGL